MGWVFVVLAGEAALGAWWVRKARRAEAERLRACRVEHPSAADDPLPGINLLTAGEADSIADWYC